MAEKLDLDAIEQVAAFNPTVLALVARVRELEAGWPCVTPEARFREHAWNIAHPRGQGRCVRCDASECVANTRSETEKSE